MSARTASYIAFSQEQVQLDNVIFAILSLLAVYLSTKAVYRLWFHPLAKFPGPKLAAATSAFEFYYSVARNGLFPLKIEDMHRKYGPVVRINPNELHFSDPEFYNEIYTGQSNARDKYAPFYRFTGATHSAFETHNSRLHNSRRQPLMSAFSKRAVVNIEPLVWEKVNHLAHRISEAAHQGVTVKLDAAFSALTADITSEYGFGHCLGYLADDNFKNDIRESLLASLNLFHVVRFFPLIMRLAKVLPYRLVQAMNPNLSKVLGLRRLIRSMVVEELAKLDRGSPSNATIVKALSDPSIPASERSMERLGDEGFVFLNAGVTAGKTLAFTIFQLLADDKRRWNKLRQVLTEAFPDPNALDHVAEKELEALPYLLFPNPAEFRPERWIEAREKGQKLENYIVTFSKGTRHCLGMNLAYTEIFITVAVLVRRFDMELYDTTEKDVEVARDKLFGYPMGPSEGVRVIPTVVR
ncbi:hypothetical protein PG994_008847 [Apiospora phragmitis]|uniref:Cytochrome P450 n=1 Tax=Apiospora phragmitis TaxID=2905665 RepID=A0ABR1UKM8_9PEZI